MLKKKIFKFKFKKKLGIKKKALIKRYSRSLRYKRHYFVSVFDKINLLQQNEVIKKKISITDFIIIIFPILRKKSYSMVQILHLCNKHD